MLGGFRSTTGMTEAVRARLALATALLVLLTAGSGPARSEGSAPERAVELDEPVRVSTSPDQQTPNAVADTSSARRRPGADGTAPLTRAAARQRVQTISPAPWLAGFGAVSVELRE
jgi:hypothetical protein